MISRRALAFSRCQVDTLPRGEVGGDVIERGDALKPCFAVRVSYSIQPQLRHSTLSHPASQPKMSRHVRGQESRLHLLLDHRCRPSALGALLLSLSLPPSPQCVTECITHANSEAHPSHPIPPCLHRPIRVCAV